MEIHILNPEMEVDRSDDFPFQLGDVFVQKPLIFQGDTVQLMEEILHHLGCIKTLQIMGYLPYQLVLAGFLNHQQVVVNRLVVSTQLKNISQIGNLSKIGVKTKNI